MLNVISAANAHVLGRHAWPPPGQREVWNRIDLWAAFRRSDEAAIKQHAGVPWARRYIQGPVPRLIARAKGNLLYGEPCDVAPASESDVANMDRICRENAIADGHSAELHRAAVIASSEREVWGRIVVAPQLLDVPIIEFCSRRHVIPRFAGRFVVGATFVKEWQEGARRVWRLLEHYDAGTIKSELYLGTPNLLGAEVSLDSFDPTKGVEQLVLTGFDRPLCVFIPNALDGDPCGGYSDYQGLEERFLAVNEAATVAQENLRLAGQQRALVDARYTRNGKLLPGHDVWVRSSESAVAGDAGKALQVIDYDFKGQAITEYTDSLIDATLSFGGASPQLVGRSVDGGALSGTALRLKLTHSLMEAAGTGGFFDRGVQRLVRMAAVIDSRPVGQGGFGRRWATPDEDPSITRGDGLPRDDMEAAQWLVLAFGAEAISLEERVRWLHPDWRQNKLDEEVARLRAEEKAKADAAAPRLPGDRPGDQPSLDVPPSTTLPGLPDPATTRTR